MSEIKFSRRGDTRDAILSHLRKNPGLTAEQLAVVLDKTGPAIRCALAKLADHGGVIVRYRKGREFVYALAQQVNAKPTPSKEPEAVNADVEALKDKLAELEAFKAKALAVHPDLRERDYEPYRSLLVEFYRAVGNETGAHFAEGSYAFDDEDATTIEALIVAAKAIAEIEGRADADPA